MNSVDLFTKLVLEKLGKKFWFAALAPSAMLVVICAVVFDPLLEYSSAVDAVVSTLTERLLVWFLVLIIPSLILGFILYVSQTFIFKIYEGYFFPAFPFRFMRNREIRRASTLLSEIYALKEQIANRESKGHKNDRKETKIEDLKDQYYALVSKYDQLFSPYSAGEILPTRLGNILRAAEAYSGTRYGMDAVSWWSRLYNLFSQETKEALEDAADNLRVLLNLSYLSFVFFALCLIVISYIVAVQYPVMVTIGPQIVRYLYVGVMALFASQVFYRMSLHSASDFGMQIRSAVDLYRLQLLEQMRIKLPKDSAEEFYTWKNLGELIVMGQFSLDFTPLVYNWQSKQKKTTNR